MCLKAKGFGSIRDALSDLSWYEYPMIVKPTDSAGSKGVTKVNSETELKSALEHAFDHSIGGRVIVEEYIEKKGCSSDTDSFSIDGQTGICKFLCSTLRCECYESLHSGSIFLAFDIYKKRGRVSLFRNTAAHLTFGYADFGLQHRSPNWN